MSYINIMNKMKSDKTDGTEFCKTEEEKQKIINAKTSIGHTHCEYCGKEILAVWDENNTGNYWPFLGVQSKRPNVYKYSPIIQVMKEFDEALDKVWDNNLLNVHARAHSNPTNWAVRASEASIRLLCNECFQKTYQRFQVLGDDGITYALSVVKERNETIESVMRDLGIRGKILGKGAIREY